jgi:phosphoenolpyruvate phosphomutase
MDKAQTLRALICSRELHFLMEAHNALSAKIVEEAGFPGIWASGLTISATLGLADRNVASWTQILHVAEFMSDHTAVPILFDGDTGFGNFNNVRHLVRKLCQIDVAGVCLEDKLFPKTNSFIGNGQDLEDKEVFCGKIRAAKDAQKDRDFCVIARVEALVSGCPMSEALDRANCYRESGADAILIHSKKEDGQEILEFCRQWHSCSPIVIVPTKYYRMTARSFRVAGVSCVIWANHSLRASISAMRRVTRSIRSAESVESVEADITPLNDVFALTDEFEIQEAERRYLP